MKKNMSRRHFLKMGGLALAAMSVRPSLSFAAFRESETKFVSLRPSIDKRRFVSTHRIDGFEPFFSGF